MTGLLISAGVLILVIIGLRYILGRKISLRIRYALWLLVALRLLIPIEFGTSALSLQNFTRETAPTPPVLVVPNTQESPTTATAPVTDTDPLETMPPVTGNTPIENNPPVTTPPIQIPNNTPSTGQPAEPDPRSEIPWTGLVTGIWALGTGAMALWFLAVNLRFHKKVKKNALPIEVQGYPFPVFVNDELSSPCLVGLLHPRVYIPRETDERTLRHILIHEQTHHRHLDPLWAWVRGLCLCLYWFHPLVWWAAILSRQDCELACDEGALTHLGEQERIPYGDTLLSMISHASRPRELFRTATTMAASKKQLKERVEMIVKQPKKLWIALLSLVLILAVAVGCTFTGPEVPTETTEPTETTAPTDPTESTKSTEPTESAQKADPADTTVEVLSQEGSYRIPKLTLDNSLGDEINASIKARYSDTTKYRSVDFSWAKRDTFLSLVVFAETTEGKTLYTSYNIDLETGSEATKAQLFPQFYHLEGNVCRELSRIFARDLYARYKETGSLSYDGQTDAYFYENLVYERAILDIPFWFDENGMVWAAAEYCSPDGETGMKVIPLNALVAADPAPIDNFVYEEISFQTPTDEYFTDAYSLSLPFFLMEGERAAEINGTLLYRYHSRYSEINYSIVEKEDIISIAVEGQHAEMPFAVPTVYNLSKTTSLDAPDEAVYAMGGLNPQTYKNRIKDILLNACLKELPEDHYEAESVPIIIEKTVSDYNISRCTPYFTEDGKLWIVGTVYFLAGGEAEEMVLPVTDCQFSDHYYNYLSSRQYSIDDYLQLLPADQPDLMPFIEAAQRQDIPPEDLFGLYLRQLADVGDSAAWQEVETTTDSETLCLYGGILHEIPMNHTDATTLKEKIADQYTYWQETGTLDDPSVGNINAETEPYYQLRTVVVDGRNISSFFSLRVNGTEVGYYEVNHMILFLQIDSPTIPANKPIEVKLKFSSGDPLSANSVYLYITSNISGAR